MVKTFTRDQVIEMLKQRQGDRNACDLAQEIGVSKSFISDLYLNRRDPGPKILRFLGLVAEVTTRTIYRKVA